MIILQQHYHVAIREDLERPSIDAGCIVSVLGQRVVDIDASHANPGLAYSC